MSDDREQHRELLVSRSAVDIDSAEQPVDDGVDMFAVDDDRDRRSRRLGAPA